VADAFAVNVRRILEMLRSSGVTSPTDLASTVNDRGIRTARGVHRHAASVRNLLRQIPSTC